MNCGDSKVAKQPVERGLLNGRRLWVWHALKELVVFFKTASSLIVKLLLSKI